MLELDIQLPRDQFDLQLSSELALDSVWGVMGPSGCGKTSLLRCIAGLETKAQGRIVFNNEVWLDSGKGIFIPPEKRNIGYIFQEARLFPHLSVRGNLEFAQKRAGNLSAASPTFDDVVEQIGIQHLLDRGIEKLSGGEKQRVAIARTLLNGPQLLLMDEPLASLDWQSKATILPCLRDIHQSFGIPVIVVSHAREEVARLADNLLMLDKGQLHKQGNCRLLFNQPDQIQGSHEPMLSILEAKVLQHDAQYNLTELDVEGYQVTAHCEGLAEGAEVRVILPAHEISIVLDDVQQTSVQNRLAVEIESITVIDSYHSLVSLTLGEQNLLALLTCRAVDRLSLKVGQTVFAHFKASGLEVL